jgi:hypothetical protein
MKNHLVIADAHVHFHECFDLEELFGSAFKNFQKEVDGTAEKTRFSAFLFLAETENENWFRRFSDQVRGGPAPTAVIGKWALQPTQEECSLCARSSAEEGLYLIAGRQIRTVENLEVLALGTTRDLEEKAPLEGLIAQISRLGAIPVIPWGVGKWIGRRGKIIRDLLKKRDLPSIILGDNGNRPRFCPKPYLLKEAGEKGRPILPGTDPFPFPSEIRQIGRFGFKIEGRIDPGYPFRDIKKLLLDPTARTEAYGSLENSCRFFWNQLRMVIRKYKPKSIAGPA